MFSRARLVLLFAIAGTLAACSGQNAGDSSGGETTSEASGDSSGAKYSIAVVPKGLGHQFWTTVKSGADAAGAEFDAEILWNGPPKETEIAEQIDILQDMLSRGVDGIVMAACDENALVETINTAMDAGVPVVTIDSGVKSDRPVSFIATDNIEGAVAAADALADLIGGEGKVGLIPFVPGAATSEQREAGFKQGIEKHSDVELASVIHCHSDVAKAMAATEDMLSAHPDLKGIFAANEAACIGAMNALATAGKTGEVKLVAFDASPEQVEAMKAGSVQALIVQNPFRMGYEGVQRCIDAIEGREVEKRIDTGVIVVTPDNLESEEVQKLINPS